MRGSCSGGTGGLGAGPYPTNLSLLGGRVRAMEMVTPELGCYSVAWTPGRQRDPGRRNRVVRAVEVSRRRRWSSWVELGRAMRYKKGPMTRTGGPGWRW